MWWMLPLVTLGTVAATLLSPAMPGIKASWFEGKCDDILDANCELKRAQQISGVISSVRFLIIFLVSAYLGKLSDQIGRVPLLRINNIGLLLPTLALYFTNGQSALAYFTTYLLSGFVSCSSFQTVAYVADCTPAESRTRHFGYLGAVSGLAFVATPLVTAFASGLSNNSLFLISICLQVLCGLYIELVLPESLTLRPESEVLLAEDAEVTRESSFIFWHDAWDLVKTNRTLYWLAVYTLFTALPEQGVVEIVLIYLTDVLGLSKTDMRRFLGLYLSLTGVGVFVAQSLLLWIFLSKLHVGPVGLMIISTLANIGHLLVYAGLSLTHSETMAFSNVAMTTFMFVGLPAANSLLSAEVDASQQGLAMGTLDSIRSLVGAFGPVMFSVLYAYFGETHDFPQAPFLFGAAFASFALLVILGPLRRNKKSTAEDDDNVITEPILTSIA